MKRIVILLLVIAAPSLWAQDWARTQLEKSPRHREWVTVKHDGRSVETFVVYPESKEKRPVVVLIHEIFGMSDWVQDLADQVAAAGYIAVAPDLLSGMGPNGGRSTEFSQDKVTEAVSHLNPDQVTADLNAVSDYAKRFRPRMASCSWVGFAGVAGRRSASLPIAQTWRGRLYFMGRRRIRTRWRGLRLQCMGSMPATTRESVPHFRMPSRK